MKKNDMPRWRAWAYWRVAICVVLLWMMPAQSAWAQQPAAEAGKASEASGASEAASAHEAAQPDTHPDARVEADAAAPPADTVPGAVSTLESQQQALQEMEKSAHALAAAHEQAHLLSRTLREEIGGADYSAETRRQLMGRAAQADVRAALAQAEHSALNQRIAQARQQLTDAQARSSEEDRQRERERAEAEEYRRQLEEAERAESDALLALQQARDLEARERDETLRELRSRQTRAAEEMLELTRSHRDQMEKLRERNKTRARDLAAKRGEFLAKLDTFEENPELERRRREIDPLFAQLVRERIEIRREYAEALAKKDAAEQALQQAVERQARMTRRLAEAQAADDKNVVSEIHARRIQAAQAELAVADKALETRQEAWAARAEYYAEIERQLGFFRREFPRILPKISPEARSRFFTFSDENLAYALDGVQEGVQHIVHQVQTELIGRVRLDVRSLDMWRWLWGLLWRVLLVLVLMRLAMPRTSRVLERINKRLFERPFWRNRPRTTLQLTDALATSAKPLLVYLSAQFLVYYVLSEDLLAAFSSLILLTWAIDALFVYWVLIRLARVVALPRWYRHPDSDLAFNLGLVLLDSGPPANPEQDPRLRRGRKLVRSARVVLFFALITTYVPDAVRLIIGISIFSWVVDFLAVWGLFFIVYWVLSTWKDDIAQVFERLAGDRMPRAVDVVNTRKDKFYGVFIIAIASLYVLGRETVRVARKYLLSTAWFRQANTLMFRAKIELRNREDEAESIDAQLQALPAAYIQGFDDPLNSALMGAFEAREDDAKFERFAEYEQLTEAYKDWMLERDYGAVVVTGEPGAGKSALIHQFVGFLGRAGVPQAPARSAAAAVSATPSGEVAVAQDVQDVQDGPGGLPVVRYQFTQRIWRSRQMLYLLGRLFEVEDADALSEAELIARILAADARVVILDDCYQVFLRRIGGFGAMETLFNVVNSTDQRHFYLLTFNTFAWSYLNRALARRPFLGKVVRMHPWSDTELQSLVETRSNQTEYTIDFGELLRSRDPSADRTNAKLLSDTARGYFRYLQEFSGGNPRVAMVYWLRSLRADSEKKVLHVNLFRRPPAALFAGFSDDYWFMLTALAQHGSLSAAELAETVHLEERYCELALRYFQEVDILVVDSETHQATFTPLYYRQILKYLAHSNFLDE